jgi:hypothetical protein
LVQGLEEDASGALENLFPFPTKNLDEGLKYLGFVLKPNDYLFRDWIWLYKKIQAKICCWVHRWLSRGGHLTLLNSVLSNIPIYWDSIAKIPKGIFTKIKNLCFHFMWSGNRERGGIPLVKWSKLAMPKELGDGA